MPNSNWSARFSGPAMIERNKAQTVEVSLEKDGAAATITSATFTLYDSTGAKVKDAVSATVAAGTVSGAIDAADTDGKDLGRNWLVQFDVTIATKVYTFYNDAVLCPARLYSPIGQTDLIARHSDVANLVSTAKNDLQDYIEHAWSDVTNRMYSEAVPFWKFRTPSALRQTLFARCFEMIFRDYSTLFDASDRYADLSDRYGDEYEKAFEKMRNSLDLNEDNTIDTANAPSTATIYLSSGPRRSWR